MTSYRLTYFDIDGGRAEPIRVASHAAGIEFEDNRISFAEFQEMRQGTGARQEPMLVRYVKVRFVPRFELVSLGIRPVGQLCIDSKIKRLIRDDTTNKSIPRTRAGLKPPFLSLGAEQLNAP